MAGVGGALWRGDRPGGPHSQPPEQFSYSQLHQRIEQAAAGFAALGIGAGDVVALFAENSPRWLVADQALMRLGAADAVRGSSAPADELRYIAADSGAVALVLESAALLSQLEPSPELLARLRAVVLLQGEPPAALPGAVPCLSWMQLLERGPPRRRPPGPPLMPGAWPPCCTPPAPPASPRACPSATPTCSISCAIWGWRWPRSPVMRC